MNVAIVSPEFPPFTNWGGIATFNSNLAQLLSKSNYKVHVITFDGTGAEEREVNLDNIVIHYVRFKTHFKIINLLYYRFPLSLARSLIKKFLPSTLFILDWNFFSLFMFKKLYEKYSFKIIFAPTYHAPSLFISMFFPKIMTVLHAQGPQEELNKFEEISMDSKIQAWLENVYMINFSQKIIACSNYLYKKIIKRFPKIKKKVLYIHNFINTKNYRNRNTLDRKNIVFLGRLEYRKGIDILVKVFISLAKNNKDIKLWLIGRNGNFFPLGNSKVPFARWFSELKIPRQIRDRIYQYNNIDDKVTLLQLLVKLKGIAVFPSRYEPFGFVHIEAMAIGYLVLGSYNGGGVEIINDGVDGYLSSPSFRSVFDNINKILNLSNAEAKLMSRKAIIKAQLTFDISSAKPRMSEIINNI